MKNISILFIIVIIAFFSLKYSSGPADVVGQGYTGAPGESGTTCIACHTGGSFGSTSASLSVTYFGTPVTSYVGGTPYQIALTVNTPIGSPSGYGFQLTALDISNNDVANFSNPSANTKISTAGAIAGGRTYAEHNGTSATNTFTFDWVAPSSTTGELTFYYAVNAVNGTGSTSGDNGSAGYSTDISEEALSVEWLEFNISTTRPNQVDLFWSTANELNNEVFDIEYSTDGRTFELLSTLPGSGTTYFRKDYSFVHETSQKGTLYYRIKQVDYDKNYSYSNVKSVKLEEPSFFSIYPNPVTDILYVESDEKNLTIHIFNSVGKKIHTSSNTKIDVFNLEEGVYFLKIEANGKFETYPFVKTN